MFGLDSVLIYHFTFFVFKNKLTISVSGGNLKGIKFNYTSDIGIFSETLPQSAWPKFLNTFLLLWETLYPQRWTIFICVHFFLIYIKLISGQWFAHTFTGSQIKIIFFSEWRWHHQEPLKSFIHNVLHSTFKNYQAFQEQGPNNQKPREKKVIKITLWDCWEL